MGLKIGEKMHLMDIDENTPIFLQIVFYKHNISTHVQGIYFVGHKFGVFTILPKYHLYS
jgi:hypothetical protein